MEKPEGLRTFARPPKDARTMRGIAHNIHLPTQAYIPIHARTHARTKQYQLQPQLGFSTDE